VCIIVSNYSAVVAIYMVTCTSVY